MKSPKAPAAPDPAVTAAAQTGTNVSTALANAQLGNVNQVTPDGSLTYTKGESTTFRDPTSGAVYEIPQYTATTTLSPQQQAIKDQNDAASLNLATTANQQSGFLQGYLGKTVDTSGIPGVQFGSGYNAPVSMGIGPTAGGIQYGIKDAGKIQDRIADAGSILREFGDAGAIQNSFGDAGKITKTYGTDFSADRQRVEDAMFTRLNPQIDRAREAEETRLQNQGIRIGSDAWKNAMADFNSGVNDQRTSITLAGGQEQSRLVGLQANRAAFENSAQNQTYGQLLGRAQFGNAAQDQNFGQLLARAQFSNAGQAQQFGQNAAQAEFGNAAQAQRFGQNAAQTAQNNAAQEQDFAQTAQRQAFYNSAQQQAYNQAANNAQMNNQGRTQAISEAYAARNQPINEISALMQGSQVQAPQFQSTNMPSIPTVDYAGLVQSNYANRMAAYQQQQANKQSMLGGLFGLGSAAIMASDRRLKTDVAQIGTGPLGLPVYSFRYLWGGPARVGFMAQDVLRVLPAAVVRMASGFLAVDYARVLREEIA